jgi:phosphorylase/glycogen(starch) synthase
MKTNTTLLFEVSWEVCNKVGGIYTVIRSKLHEARKQYGDNYFLVGPLFDVNPEFTEETNIDVNNIKHKLQQSGITAKIGKWNHETRPNVVLVKYKDTVDQGKLLYQLWEDFGVDSMTGGWDYIEPVLFGTVAAKAIQIISSLYSDHKPISQFHEWITGAGLLYLKKRAPHIATVFTTHSTVLGRSMAGHGIDIYQQQSNINTDSEAARLNVIAKHTMECSVAREADCFSTVSEITGIESRHVLNVRPDLILPNGFDVKHSPDFTNDRNYFLDNRQKLLAFASKFLKRELSPDGTFILSTSGRFEFHNKGMDLLLDALGHLKHQQHLLNKQLVVYMFIIAGAMKSSDDQQKYERYAMVSTHALWDPHNDPVINTCMRLNLLNHPDDKVNVIFLPAFLNGNDGVLNMEYYDALSGCDMTVYPSFYEPWGYTPLESIAYSIPTVGSDLSGFGKWILSKDLEGNGIHVLKRLKADYDSVKQTLCDHIVNYSRLDSTAMAKIRGHIRNIALNAEWEIFYRHYLDAYHHACQTCDNPALGRHKKEHIRFESLKFRGADSPRPRFRQVSVKASIPRRISRLRDLAYNLWWSWNPDAQELFSRLDPVLYDKTGGNPVCLIETVDPEKLETMAGNDTYLQLYENIITAFDRYEGQKQSPVKDLKAFSRERPIVYFSMEYGLHECLPIYSGGLGILSGDYIKSASDLNIPLVGIGLIYKNGYFKQGISKEGEQKVAYYHNDYFRMPLTETRKNNEQVMISIEMPGRKLYARAWEARVGRVSIFFLDTDIPDNNPADREITSKLYGGDRRLRIEQEILLGIGGVRLLQELNLNPVVFHINEGHSAFLIVERIIHLMKYSNLDLKTAQEVVKASTVFTTHTPVPAGNETFDMKLAENYLRPYVEGNGLGWQEFNELGHKRVTDTGPFEMTVLALKNSHKRNSVSKLHKLVSREIWSDLWKGMLQEEVPIQHITNGVHAATWMAPEIKNLIDKYCATGLNEDLLKENVWKKIADIPDDLLWQAHLALKNRLISDIKERITAHWTREGEGPALIEKFSEQCSANRLTIGFARRFAIYKRPTLIFRDFDRLKKILADKKHPVQFIFAGKTHPADKAAFDLIKEIVALSKQDEFIGKIIFLENYDMKLARHLIAGVDVWLNTPRRPLEASGTSGQKAGMNGVVNFSVLDGWWDEGFNGQNGFALGERTEFKNPERQDIADSEAFYDTLENEIIPAFFNENSAGLPGKWIKTMKHSMESIIAEFNTHRMLNEYMEKLYLPTANKFINRTDNNFSKAKEIAGWKKSMTSRFSTIHINNIIIEGIQGDNLNVNDAMQIILEVDPGRVKKEELKAETVVILDKGDTEGVYPDEKVIFDEDVRYVPMEIIEEAEGLLKYRGKYIAEKSGKINYGVRILPFHKDIENIFDLNLVYWG